MLPSCRVRQSFRAGSAGIRFSAGRGGFTGSLEALSESREEAAQLLRLALTTPHFDADAVERVRQRLKVGIARALREPDRVASAQWDAVAFAGHPYAQPGIGTAASVGAITADDLEVYRGRIFARNTLKVVAVGDITPDALGTLLDEIFSGLPADAKLTLVPHVNALPAGRLAVVEVDVPQSVVAFGMRAVPQRDPDFMATVVLNHIVGGGGFSSRLMEEVRVKRGLAYSVSTSLAPSRYAAVLRGGVATRNELVGQSIEVIRAELRKIAAGEIDARDLDNAKAYLIGSYPLRFDANGKIATQLLGIRRDGLGPQYVDNRNALVAAVTLDDLQRVAPLFDPENLIVTAAGKPLLHTQRDSAARIETSAA